MPHYKYFILLLYSCFGYVEDDNQRGLGQRNEIEGKEKEKKSFIMHHRLKLLKQTWIMDEELYNDSHTPINVYSL